MRYAIFSDIHNESAALALILKHAGTQQVDAYFCLGDVGIDACVNQVRDVGVPTVFGNWEASNWRYLSSENQKWALNLPAILKLKNIWLTHAAPFWPDGVATLVDLIQDPYRIPRSRLFPYLHVESELLWEVLAMLGEANVPLLFHGHTHRQMAWQFTGDNQLKRLSGARTIQLTPDDTLIVGVGSVGRPLDSSSASYVIYDDEAGVVELIRV